MIPQKAEGAREEMCSRRNTANYDGLELHEKLPFPRIPEPGDL